jgi:hypothetical protein
MAWSTPFQRVANQGVALGGSVHPEKNKFKTTVLFTLGNNGMSSLSQGWDRLRAAATNKYSDSGKFVFFSAKESIILMEIDDISVTILLTTYSEAVRNEREISNAGR